MTETEEFLEILTDPLRHAVRKSVFELYNSNRNHLIIYDLRIQQVNELPYYHVVLETDNMSKLFHLHEEMLDSFEEYVSDSAIVTFKQAREKPTGKWARTYYVYDKSLQPSF